MSRQQVQQTLPEGISTTAMLPGKEHLAAQAIFALARLVETAKGRRGECAKVAHFLLGLYDGRRYRVDLTELRSLDSGLVDDCLCVLAADGHRLLSRPIHQYFPHGNELFQEIRYLHGFEPAKT